MTPSTFHGPTHLAGQWPNAPSIFETVLYLLNRVKKKNLLSLAEPAVVGAVNGSWKQVTFHYCEP